MREPDRNMNEVLDGELPEWNLDDLFLGISSPALKTVLGEVAAKSKTFAKCYRGRVRDLEGDQLAELIKIYEGLQDSLGRIVSYSQLVYAADMGDSNISRFFQTMQERCTDISADLLFVTLELNRIEDGELGDLLESPALSKYQPWIRDRRAFRPYQLSDDVEALLHEKHVSGRGAWIRLFDETVAGLQFSYGGKSLNTSEIFDLLSSPDGGVRRDVAAEIARVLNLNIRTLTLITNTLIKDKEIEDRWRQLPLPISSRNLENMVEDNVVEALITSVKQSYPRLSHRYYKIKARWLGLDQLEYWDRNAPLPEDDDRLITWKDAKQSVLSAYRAFSPKMADIGALFFDNGWIDARVRPDKTPGAFSHPTVPSAHPYILLNYQGRTRDVMTLAHELGHGVHQVLAARQGPLMAETPLTLAETASVFGEQLTFRAMLDGEQDAMRRRIMLAGKVEDMLNTVVRQVAFCEFERRLHDLRPEGELASDAIGDAWMDVQRESLGPGIRLHDDYRAYWSYIPHFIHTPFYVYAYAFGDCLVNALYGIYQSSGNDFEERYLDMLSSGGAKRHGELLEPFGLDASDPAFWNKGLNVIEGFVDELEQAF